MADLTTARKRPAADQTCDTCGEEVTSWDMKKFSTCAQKPCNKTCNLCWKKYLKVTAMETPLRILQCHVCDQELDLDELLRKPLLEARDAAHFRYRRRQREMDKNGERECLSVLVGDGNACKNIQEHNRDVRISKCEGCGGEDCTFCGHTEHYGQTCDEFQAAYEAEQNIKYNWSWTTKRGPGEQDRKVEIPYPLSTNELLGYMYDYETPVEQIRPCPHCGIKISLEKKCARLRCIKCSMEFCMKCDAPYLGKDGVAELGNAAHTLPCHYASRTIEARQMTGAKAWKAAKAVERAQGLVETLNKKRAIHVQ
ncbi:Hypothetical predicted protein [Lecanosticta acicola]|uniref:RING-type domain-containing protein n=1 Tax=Lecanosticta acicola TaxID=111012 RepID=A0AAI9E8Y4_9PEZI|nr:Hypothetical predicted protein [Lecanosticta acicola]